MLNEHLWPVWETCPDLRNVVKNKLNQMDDEIQNMTMKYKTALAFREASNKVKQLFQEIEDALKTYQNICECGDESCTYSGEGGCDCVGRCNGRCVASNTYDDD
jgi:hypothetical protein